MSQTPTASTTVASAGYTTRQLLLERFSELGPLLAETFRLDPEPDD